MPVIPVPINVTMTTQGSVIDVSIPPVVRNQHSTVNQYQLVWNASGPNASFPSSNPFSWKGGSGQPNVTRNSTGSQLISDPFWNNGSTGSRWEYTVGITNGTVTVNVDPEIDNEPPPRPVE